ncbi:MAG: hypothetical protein LBM75_06920 [Myxococcales bacterium]|jgi:hypothetical protein|nr:hypothetical protein [Myxococcales bacterium]
MALSKELLDALNDPELALACDRASVNIKLLVASWDGLASAEEQVLERPLSATLLSDAEVKMMFSEHLEGLRTGKPVEDDRLKQVFDAMDAVPEQFKSGIGHALFEEAMSILSLDKILSKQERELILDVIVPRLLVSKDSALACLDALKAHLMAQS